MPEIHILPDHVANQIAAGEVVERPVAVVKELIENSLDAGAKHIEVDFRHGGKSFIRVSDDGSGMTPDEALLCLERHATSKIREAADLMKIRSFGFRGEALPSIASVSRFTLRTRKKSFDCGTEVFVNAGKLIHRKECVLTVGTQIEVMHLFNSVPVRRKFMKTENTEAAHIVHLVRLYAVGYPGIGFTLAENGRIVFNSLKCRNLMDRVSCVWNGKLAKDLIEINAEEGGMHLKGLIGRPGSGRATRQEMVTFVNGRPVESKALNYALIESYHTYIPKGRYPVVFLFLEIDPEYVDVNIHPAKREVRFRNDALVRQFLIGALLEALRPTRMPQDFIHIQEPPKPIVFKETPENKAISLNPPSPQTPTLFPTPFIPSNEPPNVNLISKPSKSEVLDNKELIKNAHSGSSQSPSNVLTTSFSAVFSSWRFIGKLMTKYCLFEAPEGLIVMDIKNARQRVLYEKIQKSFKSEEVQYSQSLLFPIPIGFDYLTATAFESCLDCLNKGSFKIVIFGRNFYRIEAIPTWLEVGIAEQVIKDIAALVREQGSLPKSEDLFHQKIAHLATTRTFQFENSLSDDLIEILLKDLLSCDNPLTCPRGKPTYFELSRRDLEKRFGGYTY